MGLSARTMHKSAKNFMEMMNSQNQSNIVDITLKWQHEREDFHFYNISSLPIEDCSAKVTGFTIIKVQKQLKLPENPTLFMLKTTWSKNVYHLVLFTIVFLEVQ